MVYTNKQNEEIAIGVSILMIIQLLGYCYTLLRMFRKTYIHLILVIVSLSIVSSIAYVSQNWLIYLYIANGKNPKTLLWVRISFTIVLISFDSAAWLLAIQYWNLAMNL